MAYSVHISAAIWVISRNLTISLHAVRPMDWPDTDDYEERTRRQEKAMRKALETRDGERTTFLGTFERMGTKRGWMGDEPTVLLRDIRTPDGAPICDHLWFNLTRQFAALNLTPGDVVQFDARVKEYEKGYKGRREDVYVPIEIDYKLSHPTKVRKVER